MSKRKRQTKTNKPKAPKRKLRYYPVMFCVHEDLAIALCTVPVGLKGDRFGRIKPKEKVIYKHWMQHNCTFRAEEYVFNMKMYQEMDIVRCPKCGNPIDFRLFPSTCLPKLVEVTDEKTRTEKYPET